ncbi:MAG: hypothetical protein VR74_05290 [Hyphomonas sp. BRH_c22]|uniref:hypothetical protein n=1 Tax=Hyphomonas sp. BRH_c22 TaxID=1629710 RepID=UPI0005F133E9|nr:hypothetical protein [Hyphomonas sp. BRH_c22]KJS38584.1 MAG: hypothetical protein VR74_05290 [Hyphomonas sp. BRH_c22]
MNVGFSLSEKEIDAIRNSVARDGFGYLGGSIPSGILDPLRRECIQAKASAKKAEGTGDLAYRSSLASLGDFGQKILKEHASSDVLELIFGRTFKYCEDASCYTYYDEGDFLGPHLDGADNCEVTLLLYLDASEPGPDHETSGLYLTLYDADGNSEASAIETAAEGMMIGYGSKVMHGRKKLAAGEHIWMLTACFTSG